MNKRWYPVAFSMTIIGCGGDVDDGKPAATGGMPNYYYGPAIILGGATSVDAGKPTETGGATPIPPYGVVPTTTGGRATGTGGATSPPTGGSSPIDAGTPATGGYHPVPLYLVNLRLPPKDATGARYYAHAFDPRPQRDPT